MKYLKFSFILVLFFSCGKTIEKKETKYVKIPSVQKLEGLFYLPNGGYIEFMSNYKNKITSTSNVLVLENGDGSLGNLGTLNIPLGDLGEDGKFRFSIVHSFGAANNVYSFSNVLINGSKRIDFIVYEKKSLNIDYRIYNGSIGSTLGTVLKEGTLKGVR